MSAANRDESSDAPPVPMAWAVILSVFLVIGGLFFGLPWLLAGLPSIAISLPVALLLIPALPTITGWLQGRMDARQKGESGLRALPREYAFHLWRLALELTMLLAALPVIAAQLLGVISAIIFIAFAAVLLLALAQQVFGLRFSGVAVFSWSDVWFAARLMLGSVVATIACYGFAAMLERVFDRGADVARYMNSRATCWLQRHF